jgi:hypothetical protein
MYYLTGTTSPFWPGTVCPGIKLWSSKDLLNWKFEGFLIERSKLAEDVWYRDRFWASEIHQKGGKFWLTSNCRNESEKHPHVHSCGLAVAEKITGPYEILTHDKPLLEGWGNDMTLFTDDDGKTYAYWKRHFVQQIDLEHARLVGERRRTIMCYDHGWEKSHLEGMFIIKRGGVYYMFYSAWTRGYEVGYATAKHPMGPWTKYKGNPIYGAQDPQRCKETGVEYTGDPNSPYYGVGHCTIFTGPDGRDWICAHHHMKGCGPKGSDIHLGFDPIWIEDGIIKTNGPTYTEQVVTIPARRPAGLDAAIAKIDMQLYEQSEADIGAWLDARLRESGDFGVYSFGWAQWQFVWDVRLALGKIDADTAARGGLGLESERLAQPWDMMWHWESRCIDVEDWLAVPLQNGALKKALRMGSNR